MADNLVEQKKKQRKQSINISQSLVIRPPNRQSIGIGKLQGAISSADRGRRERLYDIYNELLRDPVLSSAVERRVLAVTNTDIVFQKDNIPVDAITEIIGTHEFEELISQIIQTKIFGKTILELDFTNGLKVDLIDRRHVDTERKQILRNISDTNGYNYENDDFLLNLGKNNDLGLLLKIAPFAIFKREGFGDFAEYVELYGIDTFIGLYDPEDDNGRQEMEQAFIKRGSNGSMTMSKNSDIKTVGTQSPGTVDIHDRFLNKCDEQILIGILGQTMTTKNGASLSQSKTHAQTEDDINQADRRYTERVLNQLLLPKLAKRGYPVDGGKFIFSEKGENLTKEQELEIAIKVDNQTEHGVDDTYFHETFGLPKGKKQQKINKKKPETSVIIEENNKEGNLKKQQNKPIKKLQVTAKELSLFQRFKDFFVNAPK